MVTGDGVCPCGRFCIVYWPPRPCLQLLTDTLGRDGTDVEDRSASAHTKMVFIRKMFETAGFWCEPQSLATIARR